jgi:YidC/Oxa1 family membrane protein insertase
MQDIQPKMTALQEKYKDNQQKLQEETAKLYKEAGYNPVSGCLPMIVQFVILFAMYNLFNNYFEFRGALFIPGWIPDLSSGDSVLTFGFSIPFLGNHLRLLPIIYLISQLFFGKITQNGGTTGVGTSKTQMNIMMYGMPIFFFFLFYNAPSGLLIYWTVSNLMQMGQQLVINRMMAQKKEEMRIEKSSRQRTYPPKKR